LLNILTMSPGARAAEGAWEQTGGAGFQQVEMKINSDQAEGHQWSGSPA
jgi:hypothetical protein